MNILKDINRSSVLLLIFVFFFTSCIEEKEPVINFNVIPEFDSTGAQVRLKLTFKSKIRDSFIFDKNVFSVFNPNFEDENLLPQKIKDTSFIDELKYSQCIVEDKRNKKRFFSNVQIFDKEVINGKSIFMLTPNYDTINLVPNIENIVTTSYFNNNRIKNDEADDTMRITYLYKPTPEERMIGFKPKILTSNWFKIKQ